MITIRDHLPMKEDHHHPHIINIIIISDNRRQEYMLSLDGVRKEITQLYIKGRISDAHYNVLDKIVSDYIAKADNK